MTHAIRVTTLVEDTVNERGLLGEHGLAFWVEAGRHHVLFDTGQGMALEHNARCFGVHLESADAIVLSHGHYDHSGGLAAASQLAPQATIYAHSAAFERKHAKNTDGTSRDVGIPAAQDQDVRWQAHRLVHTIELAEVCDGIFVTGAIPRLTEFEDTGGHFFLDKNCRIHDPLSDDQALFFKSDEGTVVLLGCAHAGVINTLQYVRKLTGEKPIHAVMGGMHLKRAKPERMQRTIEALQQFNIERLGLAHCTGTQASAQLGEAFPGRCFFCQAGAILEFTRTATTLS